MLLNLGGGGGVFQCKSKIHVGTCLGTDLGEGAGGVHPPFEMTCGFLIQLIFCKKREKLCGLLVLK